MGGMQEPNSAGEGNLLSLSVNTQNHCKLTSKQIDLPTCQAKEQSVLNLLLYQNQKSILFHYSHFTRP